MNTKQWEQFFALLCKIVDMPGMAFSDKAEEVIKRAKSENCSDALEEFVSWFGGDATEEVR